MHGGSKSVAAIWARLCCLHFKAVVDNVEEMQERGTGTNQGLEKLPLSERQQRLWVVGEMLEVQLDLHTCKEVFESSWVSVLQRPDSEMQQTRMLCSRGRNKIWERVTWGPGCSLLLWTQGWPSRFQSPVLGLAMDLNLLLQQGPGRKGDQKIRPVPPCHALCLAQLRGTESSGGCARHSFFSDRA